VLEEGLIMGAATVAVSSANRALKAGKRYEWGSERPGVLERRVQARKQQMPKKRAEIEERIARIREQEMEMLDDEERFLEEQAALLSAYRERMKARKRMVRVFSSFDVARHSFTREEIEAVKAGNPDADDEIAIHILSKRRMQVAEDASSDHEASASGSAETLSGTAEPVVPSKQAVSEKPKPAPIHIEASVTIASTSDEVRIEASGSEGGDRDWSDFNPDAWEERQDYPEHLYCAVQDRDRDYYLVPRTDLDEPVEWEETEELRAMRQELFELEDALDALKAQHGRNSMLWSPETCAEAIRIDSRITDLVIQIRTNLANR
jgi:hypothetical protein